MQRRQLFLATALNLVLGRSVAQNFKPLEGKHFTVLGDARTPNTSGKVDVLEFFSYACSACNAFEPVLEQWLARLPSDVAFGRVPVPFLANHENLQRTFFALQSLGALGKVHPKLFEAIHLQKLRLQKPDEIAKIVAKAGEDPVKFLSVFNAFSMGASLGRAKAATSEYRVTSVPTLVVAGRYSTSPSMAGGPREALAVVEYLLSKVRAAR
jgi:thiol:disulfide interchange protein DsbA